MISARLFTGLVGLGAAVTALFILLAPAEPTYYHPEFGGSPLHCGSVLDPSEYSHPLMAFVCEEALDERALWGWPLGAGGVVVVLAAALIRSKSTSQSDITT
jgi:hypothetical protein